jgi:RNA polymerase sigma-70 factor (ECF subfamily)
MAQRVGWYPPGDGSPVCMHSHPLYYIETIPRSRSRDNRVNTSDSMSPAPSNESLMARYQSGDSAAATALVHRLSPQLHRFFLVQFASRSFADDLLQETWMQIHEARQTYRPDEPLLPWVYAIARHIRVDHFRRAKRTVLREASLDDAPETAQPNPGQSDESFVALLAALPESQRDVIAMLKLTGMSIEEVARATSSSVGSVKQKAHRAYEKLRQLLESGGQRLRDRGTS